MFIKFYSSLAFLVAILFVANAHSESFIVPLVADGSKVYMAGKVNILPPQVGSLVRKDAIKKNDKVINYIKKGDYQNAVSSFSKKDNSYKFVFSEKNKPEFFDFYKNVGDKITYRDAFIWGDYVNLVVDYDFNGRPFVWREGYFCPGGKCLKTNVNYSQLFEFAYDYYSRMGRNIKGNKSLSDVLVDDGISKIFSLEIINRKLSVVNKSNTGFSVGIALSQFSSSVCLSCEKNTWTSLEEKAMLSNFHGLIQGLVGKKSSSNDADPFVTLAKYATGMEKIKLIPIVSWKKGFPELSHTDYSNYIEQIKVFSSGKLVGYMRDGQYAYVFMSRDVESKNNVKKLNQFQIFVLKKVNDVYKLLPHTERELDTRTLVFDNDTLKLLSAAIL